MMSTSMSTSIRVFVAERLGGRRWGSIMYRSTARKLAIGIAGFSVLAAGIALIVLPGPAIVVIPLGLAILAKEFPWARRLLDRSRSWARRGWARVRRGFRRGAPVEV